MRQLVHDDMVVWPDQRHHRAIPRSPTGREKQRVRHMKRLRDGPLKRQRNRGIAQQRTGARAVHAKARDGFNGRCMHLRVAGKPQIVLRRQVDATTRIARFVPDGGRRCGGTVE